MPNPPIVPLVARPASTHNSTPTKPTLAPDFSARALDDGQDWLERCVSVLRQLELRYVPPEYMPAMNIALSFGWDICGHPRDKGPIFIEPASATKIAAHLEAVGAWQDSRITRLEGKRRADAAVGPFLANRTLAGEVLPCLDAL